jgi:sugar lactone lactonase YvrE
VALLTEDPLEIHTVSVIDPLPAGSRCNDGKCDAEGRFWVGTCDMANANPTGWFFRLDSAGTLTRMLGPYICTNGPAFSPDGRILYCVDSYGKVVYRYDLAPSGDLSAQQVFVRFDEPGWGYPDGLTCDAEGCVWIAHWGGYRVSRFSAEGELIEFIRIPTAQPTSCTFGGADLKRLFVTSAAVGLERDANANGLAGAVFAVDLKIGGVPAARYQG